MRLRFNYLIITMLLVSTQVVFGKTPVEEYGKLHITGTKILDSAGNEVQLRGMSLYWSQWMGQFYTYNTVKWLRDDWKCDIVRAAMGVEADKQGYVSSTTAAQAEKQKVKTVVDAAIKLGMYVIIDWHTYTGLDGVQPDSAASFFTEMAKTYGKYPNVIYEVFNEPLQVAWPKLKTYHERILDSIRKYDSSNIVTCGTSNWSQDVDSVVNRPITKYKNIAYSLHFYAATHKQFLRDKAQQALDAGLCIFANEWGSGAADGNGSVDEASTKEWFAFMDKNKISWCNWSVGTVPEATSALLSGASPDGNWTSSQISASGAITKTELVAQYNLKHISSDSKPVLSTNLTGGAVSSGISKTLSVSVANTDATIQYKWYFNGTEISGATTNSYNIASFSDSNVGKYWVVVSNKNGSTSSDTVSLSIVKRAPYKGVIAIPGTLEAENYDIGGNNISYYDTDPANQGGGYRLSEEVDVAGSDANGYQVGWVAKGEWMEYTVNVATAGEYDIAATVGTEMTGGVLTLTVGSKTITSFAVPNTNSWDVLTTVTNTATLEAGQQIFRLNIGSSAAFDIDKLVFTEHKTTDQAQNASVVGVTTFPNPTKDIITITTEQPTQIYISSQTGILDSLMVSGSIEYSMKNFANGVYYLQYVSVSGVVTQKIVKL